MPGLTAKVCMDKFFCDFDPLDLVLGSMMQYNSAFWIETVLKEYYEIVDEAHPLSEFFPTHADLFTEMHF